MSKQHQPALEKHVCSHIVPLISRCCWAWRDYVQGNLLAALGRVRQRSMQNVPCARLPTFSYQPGSSAFTGSLPGMPKN